MNNFKRAWTGVCVSFLGLLVLGTTTLTASAQTSPPVVIDDFEDGDASDWGFFGGSGAGGGGGALDDRPKEGSYYLSTGWGGGGSASVFYGGFFRNFDNSAQAAPPADPWFNVWVLNQSDATVDQFTLEITLREDLNGDGWTDGAEDSIRLDAVFTSAEFDDQWVLISAPLGDFANLATGGDGIFNGSLDEVVVVVAGVAGGDGSVVEVDFDQFAFTSGGPLAEDSSTVVFDDMEHGNPGANGWFSFGGAVGGGGIAPNTSDLPPSNGGAFSLETGWGSGGVPGFFGGFGRTNPVDLSGTDHFNFWINPNDGQDYTLEINLQEDDNGDNGINAPDDDEFQYNCVVSPTGPCAVSGGGWQLISIPLEDFVDDNSFLTGGNGVLDADAAGNGQLINVVIAVIGNSGSDVNFRTDYWAFSDGPLAENSQLVDDFENGLPEGSDVNGVPIGFYTFSDGSPIAIATTAAPPAPVPGSAAANDVLAMTGTVDLFAGFIHGFENEALDTWVTQDWSGFVGLRFWFYGQNTGNTLFLDVIDNRNPGSTTDDAERFSVSFVDDFSGWQLLQFPFASLNRKEIGNGAPNDGFTLTQVYGWAVGTLTTQGEVTYYIDNAELYGTAEIPALAVSFTSSGYGIEEGTSGVVGVALNRPMNSDDPLQVSVNYASEPATAVPGRDYTPTSGTLTFVNGGPSELSFTLDTADNSDWEGNKSIDLVLSDAVDVETGFTPRATAFIVEDDEFDPNVVDQFESFPYLWDSSEDVSLANLDVNAGDPLARPGQDAIEGVLQANGPQTVDVAVSRNYCPIKNRDDDDDDDDEGDDDDDDDGRRGDDDDDDGYGDDDDDDEDRNNRIVRVSLLTTDSFDALSVDHTTVTLGNAREIHVKKKTGEPKRHEKDVDRDGDVDLVFHFRFSETGIDCESGVVPLNGLTFDGQAVTSGGSDAGFMRDFPDAANWSQGDALTFWYYGTGSGTPVTVQLKDNRAPDPGPAGWGLVWSEEFNEPAGTPPNPDIWTYEIGDGSRNGIPGWGNDELQYYTDDPANAATDGQGNMVLTVREADGSLDCYYGPCDYSSARIISKRKAEFAYGRIESRILVPEGGGIWPAFWSLGTDIDLVNWPQTGEIDFMEFVGRLPNEIFGTVHGPGYNGGNAYGNIYDFGEPVFNNYHTFTVEWQPDLINWYVDGIHYHTATPADVPGPWVFNDAVFLLLNVAIGGNFGGAVDPDIPLPASMAVDYIRVYQAPDTAERFEATFVDDVPGWRQVEVPFSDFVRSAEQPAGAPDDGLGLEQVWGYGFKLTEGGSLLLDQVSVQIPPPPSAITVSSLADSGEGSLRRALENIADGGTISFDPGLTGGTLSLTSGPLALSRDVVIDGAGAPGISIDGGGADRLMIVDAGVTASVSGLALTNGYGFQLAGGILNNGVLTLDRFTVSGNTMTTDAGDFWQGGGGIYNGDGSTLNLVDSTVANNSSGWTGGGIYSFFNTNVLIQRSTVSGNVAADVGGGMRSLGNVTILNSTVSGNTSTAWHGGAAFITDGTVDVINSTVTANIAPAGTAGGFFVGTFTDTGAALNLSNSIVANNNDLECFQGFFGGGAVSLVSEGYNIDSDGTCNLLAAGDQPGVDPLLAPLSDNGGPTLTHALDAGSAAIDAAGNAACPATDQRGVTRPQGAACDVGAFESAP